jgi:hypothetical protein
MKHVLVLVILIILGCTKNSSDECPKNIACTEVFVSIAVKIQKENQPSFKPANLEVIFSDSGYKKSVVNDFNGMYTFINDNDLMKIQKSGTIIYLIGKDGLDNVLFNEKYVIGHDCCHVIKLSGKDVIIIK